MTLTDQQVRDIIDALCMQANIPRKWRAQKLHECSAGPASLPALAPLVERYLTIVEPPLVSDRIKLGSFVRVSHQAARDRNYVKESRAMRQAGDTLTGIVIAEHDSHGLCYEVRFTSSAVITYDHEELEIMQNLSEKHREEYGEYTCIYPQPGCQIDVLKKVPGMNPEWLEASEEIMAQPEFAARAAEGLKYQGCCCGNRHLLLADMDAQMLRDAGFVVENDTETV